MSQFMVEFDLPSFTEEFVARIPAQRLKINELLVAGKIHSYSLSLDRSRLWCIINADTEIDVLDIIDEFPLKDFMYSTIHPLMFSNGVTFKIPAFSLN